MTESNTSTDKCCTKCATNKNVSEFHNDKKRPDGKFPWCKLCVSMQKKEIYIAKREVYREKGKANYEANKNEYKARAAEWAKANPEKRKQVAKKYSAANPEKRAALGLKHRTENPGYYRAHFKMRQTRKRRALSSWANLEAIEALYVECSRISKETGIKHHVDHYYPLTSDVVCGLHNEFNLRIVPASVNLAKHNQMPEDHPCTVPQSHSTVSLTAARST